tara:strand:- start:1629 stop:2063 length:435 start_codon:yes stop_codon:yes gene_type:complete
MPTRITNFIHDSVEAPDTAPSLGTAFATADVHVHDMTGELPAFKGAGLYHGIVDAIFVKLTSASTPTKVTIRLCLDANGDEAVVPDTEATLVQGITTAATKCAVFSVGVPIVQLFDSTKRNLYLFAKVDAGSADFEQSVITWRE